MLNRLAHADHSDLLRLVEGAADWMAHPSSGQAYWVAAERFVAAHLLARARTPGDLGRLQCAALVPLELVLIERAKVERLTADQAGRPLRRCLSHHHPHGPCPDRHDRIRHPVRNPTLRRLVRTPRPGLHPVRLVRPRTPGQSQHPTIFLVATWTILASIYAHGLTASPWAGHLAARLADAPATMPEMHPVEEMPTRRPLP